MKWEVKPEVFEKLWKLNNARAKRIVELERRNEELREMLTRANKKIAHMEEDRRCGARAEQEAIRRRTWDLIQGVES